MNSDSSTSHDIRLIRITSIQEVLISKKTKTKHRKYAEKPKPTNDSEEENLPSIIIRDEISNLEKPAQEVLISKKKKTKNRKYAEKSKPASDFEDETLPLSIIRDETNNPEKTVKKKVKNIVESFVRSSNQTGHIDDLGISKKRKKKRNKLDKEDDESSITKATHVQTESFNDMEKRKKTKRFQENTQYDQLTIDMNVTNVAPKNDDIVVSRNHKKNKENSNDKTKYELNSSKGLKLNKISFENVEIDNCRTNRKHISKDKILKKSKKVSDNLSMSSDETCDNLYRKRKRSREHSRILCSIEDILHKSKKAKSNPDKKYTYSERTGKFQQDLKNKNKQNNKKVNEDLTEELQLANESFENRLSTECAKDAAKKNVQNISEEVDRSGRDIPFDNVLHTFIKNRIKLFDKQIEESVYKNQQVNKEVQETDTDLFCKKDENIIERAGTENNCADTEEESMYSKKKIDKPPESHRKEKINPVSIKTKPSCVVEDKTNTYKSSKKKRSNSNEEINLSIVKEEFEITNDFAIDQLSVKIEDDTKGYINGIKLSTLQLSSLKGLIVTLPFIPHPVHMIETKLTNRPKPDQRKEIEALGYKRLTKFYSSSEDTKILNNWKEFCERHTLDEDPGPFLVPNKYFPHQERVKFVQYLARGLEHRTLASVYKRFRLLLSTHLKKGKFSKEEDRIIIEHIALAEQHGLTKKDAKVFAKLATILHRGRLQIEKHYITSCKEKRHKLSIKSCDTLIKNLMAVLGKEDITEMENCEITLSHWKTLEALLNHPYNYLKSYWRNTVYPKLFNEDYKNMFGILKDVTRILQEKEIHDWKVIDWREIALCFKGQTSLSLYKSYKGLVYNKVPRTKRVDLRACITYLTSNYFDKESKWFCYKTALKRISQDDNGDYQLYNI